MTAVIRTAMRLTSRKGLKTAARKKAAKMTGERQLRSSLRKIKKRWNIPARMRDEVENLLRDLFGKSPRGTTWSALAERYPERFKEYVDQAQEDAEAEEE